MLYPFSDWHKEESNFNEQQKTQNLATLNSGLWQRPIFGVSFVGLWTNTELPARKRTNHENPKYKYPTRSEWREIEI